MSDKHVHIRDHIYKAIELANKMLDLSIEATSQIRDDNSMIFFGMVRDCAFKIKKTANEILKSKKTEEKEHVF